MFDAADAKSWGGYAIAALTILFTWLREQGRQEVDGKKVEIDEAGVVIGGWKSLYEAQQSQLTALAGRVATAEKRIAELVQQHAEEIAIMKTQHESAIRERDRRIEGLRRQIGQNSKSTAQMLGRSGEEIASSMVRVYDHFRDPTGEANGEPTDTTE